MRLSARDFQPEIVLAPDSRRPIRLRAGGGMAFMLTPTEAIDLATQLADAVTQFKAQEDQP